MRSVVFAMAAIGQAALTIAVAAAAPVAPAREPTLAQQRSFQQFWQRSAPGTPAPPLRLERAPGASAWSATASSDAPPLRLVMPLCSVLRTRYRQAPDDSWSGSTSQHVWVHHTTHCGTPPATMVELQAALPEIEVLKLLQAQGELLQRARLLMAGNTSCAPARARNFTLAALGQGADRLPLLLYRNDIGGLLRLSVRPARSDFVPWNVDCKP